MSTLKGVDAYPLQWPAGWPRTPPHKIKDARYSFRRTSGVWTFAAARNALLDEVDKIARNAVLSSNFRTDRTGIAVEGSRRPDDQAVAIYFLRGGTSKVIACDRYSRFEENCRSITLALEAMRQLERHGGGLMLDRAFEGFTALPPPSAFAAGRERSCWEILGVPEHSSEEAIEAAFKEKAKAAHPDRGGSHADMSALNLTKAAALAAIGA